MDTNNPYRAGGDFLIRWCKKQKMQKCLQMIQKFKEKKRAKEVKDWLGRHGSRPTNIFVGRRWKK